MTTHKLENFGSEVGYKMRKFCCCPCNISLKCCRVLCSCLGGFICGKGCKGDKEGNEVNEGNETNNNPGTNNNREMNNNQEMNNNPEINNNRETNNNPEMNNNPY
jgi:hypothetical protein